MHQDQQQGPPGRHPRPYPVEVIDYWTVNRLSGDYLLFKVRMSDGVVRVTRTKPDLPLKP